MKLKYPTMVISAAGILLFSGCSTMVVTRDFSGVTQLPAEALGGRYEIKDVTVTDETKSELSLESKDAAEYLKRKAPNQYAKLFVSALGNNESTVPVSMGVNIFKKEGPSSLGALVTLLTLGVIPFPAVTTYAYAVTVTTPYSIETIQYTADASKWVGWPPLGLIPYFGLGDFRLSEYDDPTYQPIKAYLLDTVLDAAVTRLAKKNYDAYLVKIREEKHQAELRAEAERKAAEAARIAAEKKAAEERKAAEAARIEAEKARIAAEKKAAEKRIADEKAEAAAFAAAQKAAEKAGVKISKGEPPQPPKTLNREPQKPVTESTPHRQTLRSWRGYEEITAAQVGQLAKEYDENEVSADRKYKGKKVLVTGSISKVEKTFGEENCVDVCVDMGHGAEADCECAQRDNSHELFTHIKNHNNIDFATLKRGEKITIVGEMSHASAFLFGVSSMRLEDCLIVNE